MSPEQAAPSATDVDTRADVYGLGVLLYELFTGATPFDREQLERAAVEKASRIIREQDPPKPSTRISTLGPQAAAVSQVRHTDPSRLSRKPARRPGLDRHAGGGEGSLAQVSNGGQSRRRCAAPLAGGAGRGRTAFEHLSVDQTNPGATRPRSAPRRSA